MRLHGWPLLVLAAALACGSGPSRGQAERAVQPQGATSSHIPFKREDDSAGRGYAGWGVVGVAAAAGVAAILMRRRRRRPHAGGGRGPDGPQLLGRIVLTPHASLHWVRWGGEVLLVGCSPQGVALLGRQPADDGSSAS